MNVINVKTKLVINDISFNNRGGTVFKTIIVFAFLFLIVNCCFFYYNYQKIKKENIMLRDPAKQSELAKHKTEELIMKLSKLMILPDKETPIVATVLDAEKLKKEQPFYQNAQNGDIVLVYNENKKAIIYSPSRNLIINTGFIYYQNDSQTSQPVAQNLSTSTDKLTPSQ